MRQALYTLAGPVRVVISLLLLAALSMSSGCIAVEAVKDYCRYNDNSNDFVMGWRNTVWARQAWHAQRDQFAGHPQFHAFGEGFRDGYVSVASGGNGCPPPLPPRKYWNWRYQNPEGQAQVAAWWEGFPYGAKAADEDGAGLYQQIQVSQPIQVQYSPEFLNPPATLPLTNPAAPPAESLPGPVLGPLPGQVSPAPRLAPGNFPDLPAPQPGAVPWQRSIDR